MEGGSESGAREREEARESVAGERDEREREIEKH